MKLISLAFIAALATGTAVSAQNQNCAPRAMVLERLTGVYGETRQSIGVTSNGSVIETFANTETGTWTITITSPDAETCLAASGGSYENLTEELPISGEPA